MIREYLRLLELESEYHPHLFSTSIHSKTYSNLVNDHPHVNIESFGMNYELMIILEIGS